MAASTASVILFIFSVSSLGLVSSSSSCSHQSPLFINSLQSQCPLSDSPHSPIEVNGDFLDRVLASKQSNAYTSVLFYASWCPFSQDARSAVEVLSSMFPEVEHLAVEESSAWPSVFSRYGIHSLPAIFMFNHTTRARYLGQKNLPSLVKFYKQTTGLEPAQYLTDDHQISSGRNNRLIIMQSWIGSSLKEIITREPYLVFSTLFLCLSVLVYIFPQVFSRLKGFWDVYVPHLNMEIFGVTSQMLGHVSHMIDMQRVWTKVRMCKTRSFPQGAKNARVWASSLASVSLGESSSARSSS